ncbi:MAG: toprim domain-containing protein, partial [Candidatus Cloacimonetes bacterium]|nr:toprim domain-containing protein [Candidatus Cloacimonadota bacterium]
MKLVIVESPTKAKTISKFLGRGFTVKSSYGHIRDLPKKEMGIDIEHDFEPKYIIPGAARSRVSELKKLAEKAEEVILATDEDREGEAISWHLVSALKLKKQSPKRIVFHEITKKAIDKAMENPREIDLNLVDAQQARRVLDRLVGYELSPFLWKKIRRGLSAGRVQSVALRFISEREREIEKFKSQNYWNIPIELRKKSKEKDQKFAAILTEKNGKKIDKSE